MNRMTLDQILAAWKSNQSITNAFSYVFPKQNFPMAFGFSTIIHRWPLRLYNEIFFIFVFIT